jgi:PEGA domain-containing protein
MIPRSLRAAVPALITLALSVPSVAAAQRHRGDAPATGGAVSRESAPPSGGSGGSRGSGATASAPSSGGDSGQSSPRGGQGAGGQTRGGARTRGTAGGDRERANGGRSDSGRDGDAVPPYSRPREGRTATGEAVARRPGSGGGHTIIVPGGYYGNGFYPWGWGGLGFGGYYGGYYDPWGYDSYGYGPYQSYGYSSGYEGALRLKVKPRDASVFVDGYFAGRVDEFDGIFQRLHLEAGPHRVEIREDGYEPLTLEVRIQPDRTVTYSGELKRVQ